LLTIFLLDSEKVADSEVEILIHRSHHRRGMAPIIITVEIVAQSLALSVATLYVVPWYENNTKYGIVQ